MKKLEISYGKVLLGMFFLSIFLCGYCKVNVSASSLHIDRLSVENQNRVLVDEVENVYDTEYMRARYGHLNYGFVELRKISPTRARIGATTQAHHVCPEISMSIYVDRYDADTETWNQWRYWEYSTTNSQHLTKNMEIIVPSGYYYSVRGYHSCMHGNVIETVSTMTDGLYIGTTDKPII